MTWFCGLIDEEFACRAKLARLAHDGQLVARSEGQAWVGSGDVFVTAADTEDQGSRPGAEASCREAPADGLGARRQQHPLRTHLREAAEGGELLELQRALRAQRLTVRCADPRHEGVDVALRYLVVREHAGEDLDRGLELLGDHDVRPEARELGDLDDVAGARDDVESGIEPAGDPYHASSGGGVRDRYDEEPGAVQAERTQDLLARGVAVERRLALGTRLPHRLRVELDDQVGHANRPEGGRQVAAVESQARDDDVDPLGARPRGPPLVGAVPGARGRGG